MWRLTSIPSSHSFPSESTEVDFKTFIQFVTKSSMHVLCLEQQLTMEKNKFREKIREKNTRFTWFDKLSTSTGERAAVIIILIIGLQ